MPVLANAHAERFAQAIAKGNSQHDAYTAAGYGKRRDGQPAKPADMHANAGHLARRPEVANRIKELLAAQAKRIGISVDDLLVELNAMYMLAMRTRQPSAGVAAVIAKAKLLGLVTDKVETETTVRKPARSSTAEKTMTLENWKKKFAPGGPVQ